MIMSCIYNSKGSGKSTLKYSLLQYAKTFETLKFKYYSFENEKLITTDNKLSNNYNKTSEPQGLLNFDDNKNPF
jgi:hypothetical protein